MPAPDAPAADRSRASGTSRDAYWMPTAVLALGLLSLAMLVGSNWIRESLMGGDIELARNVGEIQTRVAIAHLWIEEYVTGDAVDLEEVDAHLARALARTDAILEQGERDRRRILLKPADEERLPALGRRVRKWLREFEDISRRRREGWERGEPVGAASPIDVEFDAVFGVLQADLQALETHAEERLGIVERRSKNLFRGMLVAWALIVVLAVTGLWTREHRRQAAERALEESRAQLQRSQKMESIGRLAGGVAHDINNHLAAITAQCELVKMKSEPDSPVAKKMDAVLSTAAKSSALIKQLLAFSRRQATHPRVIRVNQVIEGLHRMLIRLIGEDVRLETELDPNLWNVTIDPSQMEQILLNLTINAREAMPTGGRVTIATGNFRVGRRDPAAVTLAAGDYVRLTVADTGSGIPPEVLQQVFEPFFTTKEASGNSGLGLATVDGIVVQNGGQIRVESEVGQGTTFEVILPRAHAAAADETPGAAAAHEAGHAERILLVEDNEELRVSTQEILRELGYEVQSANDGAEALELFQASAQRYDLVLTDVVMPGLGGQALAARLRELDASVKIIFTSGHTDDVVLRHGVAEGDVDFLQKPCASAVLSSKIREVLAR